MSGKEEQHHLGSHWNQELQSWEYPFTGSLEQAIVNYLANPNDENKQRYLDAMNREMEESSEAIARWHDEGGQR